MSRVTALLGKRNKASSGDGSKGRDDGNASSVTSTPEKDTKAPNSSRRDRAPSFADHDPPVTGNGNRTSVIRRQPSSGSITMHSTTADGTPIVYGTTTDENQSRPGKLGVDESASNGKLRRGTFSRGGPALDIPRYHSSNSATDQAADHEMSTTQYARVPSAFQPVGEGSLSLETLLRSNNQEAVTPKAGHLPFGTSISTSNLHPELFVTEASPLPSPVPGSEPAGARRASASGSIQYPPVFETSDLGSSSSSSTASRSENPVSTHQDTSQTADVPPIQLHPSEDYRVRSMSSGSMGQSLALPQGHEYSNLPTPRGRSSTEASTGQRSSFSRSPSRSSSFPLKANKSSKKANNGIASALALSGVALASPAPGVAHPFHMNRMPSGSVSSGQRTTPIKKETLSSDSLSVNGYRQASTESTSRTDERSNPERNSTEDADGFESPTPLSHYTPNDSPRYEDDPAFHAMVSIDALGEFDDLVNHMGTGYALASSKRNAEFHALFKHVPDEDYLIEGQNSPGMLVRQLY